MHGIIASWQRLAPFHHRNMPKIYSYNVCVLAREKVFSFAGNHFHDEYFGQIYVRPRRWQRIDVARARLIAFKLL